MESLEQIQQELDKLKAEVARLSADNETLKVSNAKLLTALQEALSHESYIKARPKEIRVKAVYRERDEAGNITVERPIGCVASTGTSHIANALWKIYYWAKVKALNTETRSRMVYRWARSLLT